MSEIIITIYEQIDEITLDITNFNEVIEFTVVENLFQTDGSGSVTSVNNKTGAVVLGANDINESSTRFWLTDVLKTAYDGAVSAIANMYTKSEVNTLLDNKVDKVSGKGLSENDFTTALKSTYDAKPSKSAVLCLVGEYLPNTTLTGTTAETSLGYVLIPANTYGAGKTAWVDSLLLRATGTSTIVARMRISTSATPTIASATLLATNNITNTNQYTPFARVNIHVDSATSTKLYSATTSLVQDNASTSNITDLNIDWTVDQYIHISAQLITSGDSITLHKLRIFL